MYFSRGSSSSSSYSKNDKYGHCVQFNDPFPTAIMTTEYKPIVGTPMKYDIYLDSSGLHWFLVVKGNMRGADFPYISLEITTDQSCTQLIPTMRVIQSKSIMLPNVEAQFYYKIAQKSLIGRGLEATGTNAVGGIFSAAMTLALGGGIQNAMLQLGGTNMQLIGSMSTTIGKLCETAEKTRLAMGTYSLAKRNCQHFCNNILSAYRFPTTPTTLAAFMSLAPDMIDNVFTLIVKGSSAKDDEKQGGARR